MVTPPSQVSLSSGTDGRGTAHGQDGQREVVLRGTLEPQQLFESESKRWVDFGAGYRLELQRDSRIVHGPITEVGLFPWQTELGPTRARLGLRNIGELLFDQKNGEAAGFAYTLALSGEMYGFVSGSEADSDRSAAFAGAAHGELGFGLFAGVTHRELRSERADLFIAGISGRLPASASVFVCTECLRNTWR